MRASLSSARGAIAATIFAFACTAGAATPSPPAERRDDPSPYEQETIKRALARLPGARGTVEASPEGKILEGIEVVALEVFEDRDPLPAFLTPIANWFHRTSRPYVISREVLIAPGERYEQALIDQSARNLRGLGQLSLVLCVPLRGGAPDRVRLLVITKDVWSLRLNSDFRFAGGRLQYLLLQPSEENLLGTHQSIRGNFVMDPATIALGATYVIPRVAGSRIRGSLSASAVVNRATGRVEGSYGTFTYGQPLFSTRARWAWSGSVGWDYQISRRFIAGLPTEFDPAAGECVLARDPGRASSSDPRRCQFTRDVVSGSYGVTRSFGDAFKHDLTLGVSASRRLFRTGDLGAVFTREEQQAFRDALVPVSDTQIGPYLGFDAYSSRFFDVLDLDSLGLTESYRRGHDVSLRVAPVLKAFNSSRNLVQLSASATYTVPLGDGLVRVSAASDTELTTHGVPSGSLSVGLRIATPRWKHGRLVFDARLLDRYNNYLNNKTTLGGDTRLRGYPAAMFIGKNYWVANLEYRSAPVEVAAVQLGFTIFADAGDAFERFGEMRIKQSAGFGLRAVFPQLQRSAMRLDLGFPLTENALPPSQSHVDVVVTFGQAF